MTTAAENERLGVLETKVIGIESDVAEIKADVKTLVTEQTRIAIRQAAEDAASSAVTAHRTQTGVWVRFLSERFIAIVAVIVAVVSILRG